MTKGTDYNFVYCGKRLRANEVFTGESPIMKIDPKKVSKYYDDGVIPFDFANHIISEWDRVVLENEALKDQVAELRRALKVKLDTYERDAK